MFIYLTAAAFFFVGVLCGYVGASIFSMHKDNISFTRKNLEALLMAQHNTSDKDDSEF
jgi:hypothetical protein